MHSFFQILKLRISGFIAWFGFIFLLWITLASARGLILGSVDWDMAFILFAAALFGYGTCGLCNRMLVGEWRLLPWREYQAKIDMESTIKEAEQKVIQEQKEAKLVIKKEQKLAIEKTKKDRALANKHKLEQEISKAKSTPLLTLIESVDIAQGVLAKMDNKKIAEHTEFLSGTGETRNLLITFNDQFRSIYEAAVKSSLPSNAPKDPVILNAHIYADVEKCMDIGLNNLIKKYNDTAPDTQNSPQKSAILKTHSWDDLKDKF